MRVLLPVFSLSMVLLSGFCEVSFGTCSDQNVRIVFWAPSWWHDAAEGCSADQLFGALELADDLYGFSETEVKIHLDDTFDNTSLDLDDLNSDVGTQTTKTLYLLGHGDSPGYDAMVFDNTADRDAAYAELVSTSWDSLHLRIGLFTFQGGADTAYTVRLSTEGIEATLKPGLSDEPIVFAMYCFSSSHQTAFGVGADGTIVSYSSEPSILSTCQDLQHMTGTLMCAYWDDYGIGNELDDYAEWAINNGIPIPFPSLCFIAGKADNQLVCGKGCASLAALIDHVEAFDSKLFWSALEVQTNSYFIVRGYRFIGGEPEMLDRVEGGGWLPMGAMRTYGVPVPTGYNAFDIVEIDNAGRRTTSYPPAVYGEKSGLWDRWETNRDYAQGEYTRPRREERSETIVTGVGVRSALSFVSSDPEWVRRFNGGHERTRRLAKFSKYPDGWSEVRADEVSGTDDPRKVSRSSADEEFLADAILWAYDPWMVADMAAHLESFTTREGYPLQVRWFWGDPDLQSVRDAVTLVLEANAAHPGPRTYPVRPPLWFVGERGWTSWPENVSGTCIGNCYGYRRFYPGTGRKPVIVVPTDSLELVQRQITGTEEWNAGMSVNADGKVFCIVGDQIDGGSSWWMRDMFMNFNEAFSASGRPVEYLYESDYEGSSVPDFQEVGYSAVNSGAQYFFESAISHDTDRWSSFIRETPADPWDPSQLVTEQRTFWVPASCAGTGFQRSDPDIGRMLLYNDLNRTTAVGVLGQMNPFDQQPYKLYLERVLDAMVMASGDSIPVPWWEIAEDAAEALLEDHGDEPDIPDFVDGLILYAANPMLEPGTVWVSPYVQAEIATFLRIKGDANLYEWADTFAVGCPQGDRDEIVVFVSIDENDVAYAPPSEAITILQPTDSNIVFFGSLEADSTPTLLGGYYNTTITIENIGGCSGSGVDSAMVRLANMDLGYAYFQVKSPDTVEPDGDVDLVDLVKFSYHFPSSVCNCLPDRLPYSECMDFVFPDTAVVLADLAIFSTHFFHEYTPPGGGASPAEPVAYSNGIIDVEFEEDYPLIGPRKLRASVVLKDVEPFTVMFLSFKNENPIFTFASWHQDSGFPGRTGCVDVVRNGQTEIVLIVVGTERIDERVVNLGHIELGVASEEPLQLTDEDFKIVTAQLLAVDERELAFGGAQVQRVTEPEVFRDHLAQNFPNPFNPTTTIAFSISKDSDVELRIFDVTGTLVRTLVKGHCKTNNYKVLWDGKNNSGNSVASGVYFYRLTAGSFGATRKMVLLR